MSIVKALYVIKRRRSDHDDMMAALASGTLPGLSQCMLVAALACNLLPELSTDLSSGDYTRAQLVPHDQVSALMYGSTCQSQQLEVCHRPLLSPICDRFSTAQLQKRQQRVALVSEVRQICEI